MRTASRIFSVALEDDLIQFNPFDKVAGKAPPTKAWHKVTDGEFDKLMDAASTEWRLLFSLCRYAALRRGEALSLRWSQIDWERSRLTVIADDTWRPKDSDYRTVPIVPALRSMLLDTFEQAEAEEGEELVIPAGTIDARSSHKPFKRLCKVVNVKPWSKPFHMLRKTCLTRWAREFPQHVVSSWAGHAKITTTNEYYLQISESEYDKAAGLGKAKALSLS